MSAKSLFSFLQSTLRLRLPLALSPSVPDVLSTIARAVGLRRKPLQQTEAPGGYGDRHGQKGGGWSYRGKAGEWEQIFGTRPAEKGVGYFAQTSYRAPAGPVVLCHGLFGFDKLGPAAIPALQFHYWSGIVEFLSSFGCKVYVARVSPFDNVRTRAIQLRTLLEDAYARDGGENWEGGIHFVAHSMGGLDCRYLIANVAPPTVPISSLTTIATPHRGSSFMDWCCDFFGVGVAKDGTAQYESSPSNPKVQKPPVSAHPLIKLLASPLDFPAYTNLTTSYCNNIFNSSVRNVSGVLYRSFSARCDLPPIWSPLRFPWEVIQEREGDNDGLVSVNSARWGEWGGIVETDHWTVREGSATRKKGQKGGFDAREFYGDIVSNLAKRGL